MACVRRVTASQWCALSGGGEGSRTTSNHASSTPNRMVRTSARSPNACRKVGAIHSALGAKIARRCRSMERSANRMPGRRSKPKSLPSTVMSAGVRVPHNANAFCSQLACTTSMGWLRYARPKRNKNDSTVPNASTRRVRSKCAMPPCAAKPASQRASESAPDRVAAFGRSPGGAHTDSSTSSCRASEATMLAMKRLRQSCAFCG